MFSEFEKETLRTKVIFKTTASRKNNIKMGFREIGCEVVKWRKIAQRQLRRC
jgi:hypothetical protein